MIAGAVEAASPHPDLNCIRWRIFQHGNHRIDPRRITFSELNRDMLSDHNIMIAGAFDYLKDMVFRIGHMGRTAAKKNFILL
jgi:hypothetical protein